ncbi:50S ribosomal protein L11 methyltransferase [Aquimarina sp. ERC-38]|uniref:50S ribosomal protein L11 methyltransferase n=1 Tax=Aquimarina sp. ERC-38 TaxID=2949996 RepID=UPI002245D5F0|nr:50S ribosomal protein L11 methyltransferase [Aquimarina sp. ERC-38]UZO79246.1 50S ribosomal protein L11 methyltransferase [Aquimarina sp. ERC-38]
MKTPDYIGYVFEVTPVQPGTEILIAQLGLVGFESFVENESQVEASIQKEDWYATILDEIQILKSDEFKITYTYKEITPVNWNEEWEKNFTPIIVDDVCSIRASFHNKPACLYDIVINPKMSFGTGHHETTFMMVQHLLVLDMKGKSLLDMGCGTGVLAILAEKLGAGQVDAIDIDNWCYLNTKENLQLNNTRTIEVFEGDAGSIQNTYDIIIANINRNILVEDIPVYAQHLRKNGLLLLSGFYKEDIPLIDEVCNQNQLVKVKQIERNNWMAVSYQLN